MSIYKMQFLVELFVDIKILCSIRSICVFKSSEQVLRVFVRANTVKQGILYQTCTGPDVTMIG